MSQYIPGIVQYVPQVQPYRPDLNFYQKVLETKQAQYKAGYDQLSSLYGNLLESPMLRSENIDLRNKFFNQISADIAKVSSMDLSLPQNVEAASKIFQPLTDNKYILKDMAYTKQAYGQLRQADNFRNCTNEKECGGKYWKGDKESLRGLCDDDVYDSFAEAIDGRSTRGETLQNRLVRIDDIRIVDARYDHPMARVSVRFDADIAALVKDADGNIIGGSMTDAVETHDIWTFMRDVKSSSRNWKLDETDSV